MAIIACIECDKIFPTKDEFFSHGTSCQSIRQKFKKPKKGFKCQFCSQIFLKRMKLKRHYKKVHGGHPDKNRSCPFCEKVFKLRPSIKYLFCHIKVIHCTESDKDVYKSIADEFKQYKEQNGVKCDQCGKFYYNNSSLRVHKLNEHGTDKSICSICACIFKSERHLNHHMAVRHSAPTIPCEYCGNLYKEKRALYRHIQSVHKQIKNYACNMCDIKFYDKCRLTKHKTVVHDKIKPYSCLLCKFRTGMYGNLNQHRRYVHGKLSMAKAEYDLLVMKDNPPDN